MNLLATILYKMLKRELEGKEDTLPLPKQVLDNWQNEWNELRSGTVQGECEIPIKMSINYSVELGLSTRKNKIEIEHIVLMF